MVLKTMASLSKIIYNILFKLFRSFLVSDSIKCMNSSFKTMDWLKELEDFIPKKDVPIVLVGNKSDLTDQRVVN